jgi:putative lipoic acid-binding regulatory protein
LMLVIVHLLQNLTKNEKKSNELLKHSSSNNYDGVSLSSGLYLNMSFNI